MELVIIAVLLTAGVCCFFLGTNGMPQMALPRLSAHWPASPQAVGPARRARLDDRTEAAADRELVDLMNEMLIVREELSRLKLSLDAEPSTSQVEGQSRRRRLSKARAGALRRRRQPAG